MTAPHTDPTLDDATELHDDDDDDDTSSDSQAKGKDKAKIKFVYRDFPLLGKHPDALPAAIAAHCAGDQDKYWEMHDMLFKSGSLKENDFKGYATKLSLDSAKFEACLKDPAKDKEVRKDLDDGRAYGVNSTPTFYVNGYLVVGANVQELSRLIDRELEKAGAGS